MQTYRAPPRLPTRDGSEQLDRIPSLTGNAKREPRRARTAAALDAYIITEVSPPAAAPADPSPPAPVPPADIWAGYRFPPLRGRILRALMQGPLRYHTLMSVLGETDSRRVHNAMHHLSSSKLIVRSGSGAWPDREWSLTELGRAHPAVTFQPPRDCRPDVGPAVVPAALAQESAPAAPTEGQAPATPAPRDVPVAASPTPGDAADMPADPLLVAAMAALEHELGETLRRSPQLVRLLRLYFQAARRVGEPPAFTLFEEDLAA